MDKMRRGNIAEIFKKLLRDNPDISVGHMMRAIMRRKNFSGVQDPYDATDVEVAAAFEKTIEELNPELNEK